MPRKHHDRPNPQQDRPIRHKEDVQESNDEHIDQDFPGYPHHPSKEKNINPNNAHDRRSADAERHNGSAHAFEGTEDPSDGEE
jgi:hypothetical protein